MWKGRVRSTSVKEAHLGGVGSKAEVSRMFPEFLLRWGMQEAPSDWAGKLISSVLYL